MSLSKNGSGKKKEETDEKRQMVTAKPEYAEQEVAAKIQFMLEDYDILA